MQVNVKNHMTFTLRLFWTVIIAFLIIAFVNIYHRQHIVINLLITIAVFLPLMWSVIRRRTQNKKIRSRYPYAFKSVVESYKGFQDSMTNKSWGYLALLKGCNDSIRPLTPYEVNMDIVSNFLEGIFNLSQTKRKYSGGRSLYVLFF